MLISDRSFNYCSPRLILDDLLTVGQSYTFSVWVKLSENVSGTSQIVIKSIVGGSPVYTNVSTAVTASNQDWVQLSGNYTHSTVDNTAGTDIFVYIKGPSSPNSGKEYYIDDFSIVTQGSAPVSFISDTLVLQIEVWGSCFRLQHSFGLIVSVATSRQRRTVDFRLSHAFAMAAVGAFVARLAVSNVA